MRNYVCILIGLVLATLACDIASPQIGKAPTSATTLPPAETGHPGKIPAGVRTATASPIPTESVPITPPPHGALLYQTPFGPAWPLVTGDRAGGKPVTGGYQVDITQPWAFYLYTTHVAQSTFFAEITVSPQQCPAGNGAYGMIFHYQNDTAYRFATIWCSGRYSVMERTGPSSAITLDEDILPGEIDAATGEHIVGLHSAANKLTLYIDDRQIAQVDVTNLPTGDVGPYAETIGNPLSVLFTHLSVYYAE
jgi:hypothetical protein